MHVSARRRACAVLILFGATASAVAETSTTRTDLVGAYLTARDNNPDYRAAQSEFRAAAEAEPQALSRLLPTIRAQGEVARVRQAVEGDFFGARDLDQTDYFDRYAYGAVLEQPLFSRAALLGLDRAELTVGRAQLQLTGARQNLMLRTAEAYFNLLRARNERRLVRAEKRAISRQYDEVRGRFESGFVPEADVKAVQAQLDSVLASEIDADNGIDLAATRLEFVIGMPADDIAPLIREASLPALQPDTLEPWITRAMQHNIALLTDTVSLRVAELDTQIARAAHLPTLDLFGSHVFFDADGGTSGAREDTDSRIGVRLNVPIYQGGMVASRVRAANARAEAAGETRTGAEARARLETRAAFLNTRAARSRVDALVRAVESARSAEASAQVGFEIGTRTAADYLQAVRDRFRAERDLSVARYDYLLGLLRLRRAAGIISVADLDLINSQLQSP